MRPTAILLQSLTKHTSIKTTCTCHLHLSLSAQNVLRQTVFCPWILMCEHHRWHDSYTSLVVGTDLDWLIPQSLYPFSCPSIHLPGFSLGKDFDTLFLHFILHNIHTVLPNFFHIIAHTNSIKVSENWTQSTKNFNKRSGLRHISSMLPTPCCGKRHIAIQWRYNNIFHLKHTINIIQKLDKIQTYRPKLKSFLFNEFGGIHQKIHIFVIFTEGNSQKSPLWELGHIGKLC